SKPMAVIYTYFTDIDSKDHRNLIAKEAATKIAFYLEKDLNLKTTHLSLPLPLLMQVKAPAIMVELPNFETFSYNKTNIEALSKAIARGLILH
ncbi:MAG: hypothetical protein N2511_01815, partial [Thermodesulfovibrionales bacterium]|nr:hypothetical protein [Thermodesulfovibrionales bacterium]